MKPLDPRVSAAVDGELSRLKCLVLRHLDRCESPIEQLFMLSCVRQQACEWLFGSYIDEPFAGIGSAWPGAVYCQHEVTVGSKTYRIDFAFVGDEGSQGRRIAVELDGHDFHERTKEQAKRDKSRDRALTAAGWLVLRFTGSEVWADSHACAEEAYNLYREGAYFP